MANGDIDMVTDIIIPAVIICGLFLINGIVLYIIFRKRQSIVYEDFSNLTAPATAQDEEPSTSQPLQPSILAIPAANIEAGIQVTKLSDNSDEAFEMSRL